MKKLLIIIVFAASFAVPGIASADQRVIVQQPPVVEMRRTPQAYRPANRSYVQPRRSRAAEPNVFDRLMDLERRKNQWLLRTFLGR